MEAQGTRPRNAAIWTAQREARRVDAADGSWSERVAAHGGVDGATAPRDVPEVEPYRCIRCCASNDQWVRSCPRCGCGGTLVKQATLDAASAREAPPPPPPKRVRTIADAPDIPEVRISTCREGMDRVLGGGFVTPGVVLFAGAPGCGKSTILLPMVADMADTLYVAAEESDVRLRRRATRCGLTPAQLARVHVVHTKDFNEIMEVLAETDPRVVVIDSINVLVDPLRDNPRDTDNNMLRNANALYKEANDHNRVLVLVAQMNKGDDVRGTKELQHLVDTVMMITKQGPRRILRCPEKNRDGSVEEVAVFLMTKTGLHEQTAEESDEDDGPVADKGEVTAYMSERDIPLPKTSIRKPRPSRARKIA